MRAPIWSPTIEDEAGRMARFVANLLDMTRLEAGAIALKREPADLSELIGAAVHRVKGQVAGFHIEFDIEPDCRCSISMSCLWSRC